jgi:hypothetical protein
MTAGGGFPVPHHAFTLREFFLSPRLGLTTGRAMIRRPGGRPGSASSSLGLWKGEWDQLHNDSGG